jgi:phytol kinase
MLAASTCIFGVFTLLLLAETLSRKKILRGENQRKFAHITIGAFIAFWPWFASWRTIQLIAVAMLAVVLINRRRVFFHSINGHRQGEYGDILLAVAILLCSLLTTTEIFFTLAILNVALADGLAAVVGRQYGQHWRYKIFNQMKTVVGSMTFWLISLSILGIGILFAHNQIDFASYATLLLILPPALVLLENVSGFGLDNITIPLAVLFALNLAQTAF